MFIISALISCILVFLFSFISFKMSLNDSQMQFLVYTIYALSVFVPSYIAGKIKKTKKYLYGISIGLIYLVALFIISSVINQTINVDISNTYKTLLVCLLSGAFGGMIS